MKKIFTFLVCGMSTLAFGQQVNITSEAYQILKTNGQLNPNVRYVFPSLQGSAVHLTPQQTNAQKSQDICSCLVPLDTNFSVVPMNSGYGAPEYRNDDGYSDLIALPFSFNYYGNTYNSVFINNNGNISFNNQYSTFTSNAFPDSSFNMIAPFWGDVDTRDSASGLVYYKITPTSMIIKWEQVGYFPTMSDKTNTFQLTITNGSDVTVPNGNNVSFCYGDMQWTTGTASNGTGGFGGTPSTVGVNQGNGTDYFQVGRFDHDDIDFDGPYGNADGVSFLDNQEIYFNTAINGNIPPIIYNATICDTIDVYTGDTLKAMNLNTVSFTFSASTPEIDQIVTTSITTDAPSGVLTTVLNQNTPTIKQYTCTFDVSALTTTVEGNVYHVNIVASDNGVPSAQTIRTVIIRNKAGLTSGLENNTSNLFIVSPNPTEGSVTLNATKTVKQVMVYNVSGALVMTQAIEGLSTKLDMNSFDSGIYFVSVLSTEGHSGTVKLIKK
jgi:hypothetical protein